MVYGCHAVDTDPALLVTLYGPFGRLPPCPLPDRLRFDLACHRLGDKSPRRRAHIIELAERLADVPASGRLSRGVALLVRLSRLPQEDSRLARAVELLELVLDSEAELGEALIELGQAAIGSAMRLGYAFRGCEISPAYANIAVVRLRAAEAAPAQLALVIADDKAKKPSTRRKEANR